MSETNAIIPEELLEQVAAHKRLWTESERSQSEWAKLQRLSGQVPRDGNAMSLDPLTADNTPPTELSMTLRELEQSLTEIKQAQQAIQANEDEIEAINSKYRTAIILAALGAVVIIILLISVIVSAM
jgi:PAS domain-containing protein